MICQFIRRNTVRNISTISQRCLNFSFSQNKNHGLGSPIQMFKQSRLFYQSTSQKLQKSNFLFSNQSNPSVYCGYDPTASSLHLGNLLTIIMMCRMANYGFRPIFLLGGATASIGDPSGKSKQRVLLDSQVVNKNTIGVQSDIRNVYTLIGQELKQNKQQYMINPQIVQNVLPQPLFVNNLQFYKDLSLIDFLRNYGKYFRMNHLLTKDTVAQRLKSEQGISYTQFSYSLMQAYDYLTLFKKFNCILQIGGSDQWGNITNGCDLIRKTLNDEAFGITMPLLVNSKGQKFGKSQGNALFLKPQKDNIYNIYQYIYNSTDQDIQNMLYRFTFFKQQFIGQIMKKHRANPEAKHAQQILASRVCKYLDKDYENVNAQYFRLTSDQLKAKKLDFFEKLYSKVPQQLIFKIPRTEIQNGGNQDISVLFSKYKISKGRNHLRRQVQAGGLYINNKKVPKQALQKSKQQVLNEEILHNKYFLVRWGKKNYNFVILQ